VNNSGVNLSLCQDEDQEGLVINSQVEAWLYHAFLFKKTAPPWKAGPDLKAEF